MIERFQGPDGKRNLIAVLQGCSLVEHDEGLATRLAEVGELLSYQPGDMIVAQGESDNDLYFLLTGEADTFINNRHIRTRGTGESIGEMALVQPSEPRTASVVARTAVVSLKLREPDFHQIQEQHPRIWKSIARVIADRLRQRSALLDVPNSRPVLFLGCSTESLEVTREIQLGLKHDDIEVVIWTDGVFGPSTVTIDALLKVLTESDFAAIVFSPDDKMVIRERECSAPRDNVVFELGLSMGRLDRSRAFIVKEQDTDVRIPTDLLGITPLSYICRQGCNMTTAVAPVCTELRKVIKELGVK